MSADLIPVLVAGGGIGGLATGLALSRAGIRVHLVERAPAFTEIGAGLQVGANATRILDRLGVLDEVLAVAVRPARGVMRDARTGRILTTLTLGETYREHYGHPYVVVHRSDLLQILLDVCVAEPLLTLENNRTVETVRQHADHVLVHTAEGLAYKAAILAGADGIRSRVREAVVSDDLVDSGYVAYRGTLPISAAPAGIDPDDVQLWVGPHIHLMQYPVRSGNLFNQVAVFRARASGGPDELDARFAGSLPEVVSGINAVVRDRSWPLLDREPLDHFVYGRIALLGDAAHPMLQVLGQGACQALEGAVALADALAAHPDEIHTALKVYDEQRVPRATRCQRTARPWAEVWHLEDPLAITLRDRILASRQADDYSELDWLYRRPAFDQ
ncbi:3-hydroxybenzoate 6-hydroxylase (plasmid) [Streptomyces sp. enrichment culture]|uniref:FAD-dependent monooxygenase n=1 Tax=Streptomyces sp. enrichment culture TaxID=1795815 RepID=UPI003F56CB31